MTKLKLGINGTVEINYDEQIYKSVIQDVQDECFFISIPVAENEYLTIEDNKEIDIYYYIEGSSYFNFNSKIIERTKEGNISMYRLSKPYNIIKIQRRDFVRVNIIEHVFYKNKSIEESIWEKGLLLDLSGGGLRMKTKENISMYDNLRINLFIDDNKLSVIGKVVRIESSKDNENIYGLEFTEIDERERDKIISKVFSQMRRQREVL